MTAMILIMMSSTITMRKYANADSGQRSRQKRGGWAGSRVSIGGPSQGEETCDPEAVSMGSSVTGEGHGSITGSSGNVGREGAKTQRRRKLDLRGFGP